MPLEEERKALERLTPAERRFFDLFVRGLPIAEISTRIGVRVKKLYDRKAGVCHKLGVYGDVALALFAVRHHLVDPFASN